MNKQSGSEKREFVKSLKEFLLGFVAHESCMVAQKEKAGLENLLFLAAFGDLLGIPVFRNYHTLRLIPYFAARMPSWRRTMLKQRDWTDSAFD